MAKIEIRTRDVDSDVITSLPDQTAPQHTFIVYTNNAGEQFVLRGGQESDLKTNQKHSNSSLDYI